MNLLRWSFPDRNPHAASRWCRWGLHRWNAGTARCDECEMVDRLLCNQDKERDA